MNRLINWLQNVLFRAITTALVGIALVINIALGFGNPLIAQAASLTPEADSYQVQRTDVDLPTYASYDDEERKADFVKESPNESTVDNIREKLNLNEPIPESTKEFFGEIKEKAEQVVGK